MDNADDAERQHLEKLLRTVRRRLRPLQEQAALFGPRTPPEVHIEIEDIQAEIVKLETALKAKDALLSPPPLTPFHHDRSVSQATPPGTKSAHAKESSRDAPQPQHLLFHSQRKSNDSPAPKSFSLHAQKRNLLPAFVWRAIRGMVKTRLGGWYLSSP